MKLTAIRNFLFNGEHIAAGTTFEADQPDATRLIALHRAEATAAESKPAKKGK